jgi:hypothetical protein
VRGLKLSEHLLQRAAAGSTTSAAACNADFVRWAAAGAPTA